MHAKNSLKEKDDCNREKRGRAKVGSFLKVFSIKLLLVKGRFEKGVTYENNA